MAENHQSRIDNALKSLKKIETTLKGSNIELLEKITLATEIKKVAKFIEGLQAIPNHKRAQKRVVIADVDAPKAEVDMSYQEKTDARNLSEQIDITIKQWQSVCNALSMGIRSNDKEIINISLPPKGSRVVKNSFNNSEGRMLLIASTSSQAYAVTKNDKGVNTISAAKYWEPKG